MLMYRFLSIESVLSNCKLLS